MNRYPARVLGAVAVGALLSASVMIGQTTITPPKNKYTVAEDVELGQQAAKEV